MRGYDTSEAPAKTVTPVRVMIAILGLIVLASGIGFVLAPGSKPAPEQRPSPPPAPATETMLEPQELEMMNARLPARLEEGIFLLAIEGVGATGEAGAYVARIEAPETAFARVRALLREGLSDRDLEACKTGEPLLGPAGAMAGNDARVEIQDEAGKVFANMTWRNFICQV